MTQTAIDTSLAQLDQEHASKRAELLRLKQQADTQARELASLDATKAAKAGAAA